MLQDIWPVNLGHQVNMWMVDRKLINILYEEAYIIFIHRTGSKNKQQNNKKIV